MLLADAIFLPEWRQRGCGLVNRGGGSDASWLCFCKAHPSSLNRPVIDFFFIFTFLFFPSIAHLPANPPMTGWRLAQKEQLFLAYLQLIWDRKSLMLFIAVGGLRTCVRLNCLQDPGSSTYFTARYKS